MLGLKTSLNLTRNGWLRRVLVALGAILSLAGQAHTQQPDSPALEFDKVDYLFGPVARQTGDHVGGEVASGRLRFDGEARVLSFLTGKGPNLHIPYSRIQELGVDEKSMMRSGAMLATGVIIGPFIRQHKHFMTIVYADDKGASRTALLQLDKGNYRMIEAAAGDVARVTSGPPVVPAPNSSPAPVAAVSPSPKDMPAPPPQGDGEVAMPGTGLKVRLPSQGQEWQLERTNGDHSGMDTLDRIKPAPPAPLVSLQVSFKRGTADCKAFLSSQVEGGGRLGLVEVLGLWPPGWAPLTVTDGKGGYYRVCRTLPEGLLDVQIYNGSAFGGPREEPEAFASILNALAQAALPE